ncbi:universal stress protein [Paeniglutamicibacter kerguelensis]|uniref:Nucleotide-binding universal stress UspA family protein n=1 Tax=Paeniglutamicibacter kerguelensis TaxID=254788 RepID=A0ABS4XCW7_9MICC|nr:universal stress protein [Paeniglutamicibacter kerguelensis]MBP2386238.1 nucleotide-binding universal stress UspA family protein [Paeniglutamicibacter kerguelensis]
MNRDNHKGPLIVGVIPRQHPDVVSQAAFLAEQLGRTIIFVFVEPKSHLAAWNLTVRMTDLPVPPMEIEVDMSADAAGIFTAIGDLMVDSSATWILRIVGGEPWVALIRLADEAAGSMFVVGTREPHFGAHLAEFLNGAVVSRLATHLHLPVLVVPAAAQSGNR